MAGDVLWGRRARLVIAVPVATPGDFANVTTDIVEINGSDNPQEPGLRIAFKITKKSEKQPNPAQITVTNLSPVRRASLQTKGVKVTLEAGYADAGVTRIFAGDARTVDHKREGSNWHTVMSCGDGERSYRFAHVTDSFARGATIGDVVKVCARAMGLALGNSIDQAARLTTPLYGGYSVDGYASAALDKVVRSIGYSWSIQDGQLQILGPDETLQVSVPEISPETGLIGSPEMGTPEAKGKTPLLKFKCLLLPQARPGARVRLRSSRYNGLYRVKQATHSGDTAAVDWYTEIEGVSLGTA